MWKNLECVNAILSYTYEVQTIVSINSIILLKFIKMTPPPPLSFLLVVNFAAYAVSYSEINTHKTVPIY